MTKHAAEIVTFQLAEGVSEADFTSLMRRTESFVRAQPGFIARRLSRGADGSWTDHVVWQDMATAQQMAQTFMQQDFAPAVMQAIADGSARMRHEEVQWSMLP